MIRLQPQPRPRLLTDKKIRNLTLVFARTGKKFWGRPWLIAALNRMSHGKCAYCECRIDEESKYLEVEHFLPKSRYKQLVITWDNLLPACKRCNGNKDNHDTQTNPILHPVKDEPKNHLSIQINEKLKIVHFIGSQPLGDQTIRVVDLNGLRITAEYRTRTDKTRYEFYKSMRNELNSIWIGIQSCHTIAMQDNLVFRLKENVLKKAQPNSAYCATLSAAIVIDPNYPNIKTWFETNGLWDSELTDMEKNVFQFALTVLP